MAKKELVIAFILILIFGLATGVSTGETTNKAKIRINVGLRFLSLEAEVTDLISQYGGKLIRKSARLGVLTFKIPRVVFENMVFDKNLSKLVEYIEEDYVRQIDLKDYKIYPGDESLGGMELYPNDPDYSLQWGPPCIGAEDAWDLELGSSEVIVAIVDTGIDLDHPDIVANVDTSIDHDFVNNDDTAQDDHGHGTHVAGIVAAEINNSKGITGLQQITLMAVKALNQGGLGFDSWLADGIVYAVDNGALVINCSWGNFFPSSTIRKAVNHAFDKGALVVAAAGNSGISGLIILPPTRRPLGLLL